MRDGALELSGLTVHFALGAVPTRDPCFVVELTDPSGTRTEHPVSNLSISLGTTADCQIRVGGEAPWRRVIHHHRGGFGLVEPSTTSSLPSRRACADGEEVVVGEWRVRPRIARSFDAFFDVEPPQLAGRSGRWQRKGPDFSSVRYSRLRIPVPFSGGVLACDGFISPLYVHMGFHPAWKFEHAEELIFERGQLVRRADVSRELARVREVLTAHPLKPGTKDEVEAWIARTFELDY